jgi:cytochrome c
MKKLFFLVIYCVTVVLLNSCHQKTTIQQEKRVLVFFKTQGFYHNSIPDGVAAIQKLGKENGFLVDTTASDTVFTEKLLKRYAAVIFLNTTGNVLDYAQQTAFERYIQAGGGFVGIHAASDTELDWEWYGQLVGARFISHPDVQEAILRKEHENHPSVSFLDATWKRTDEWYVLKYLNQNVNYLLSIDEKSYQGGKNGDFHPLAWFHEFDGGRAFYTALGHTKESYTEPLFLKHLLGGIEYAMGKAVLDYRKARSPKVPDQNRFVKKVLAEKLDEPTEMAITTDGRVFFTERKGALKMYDPKTGQVKTMAQLRVFSELEDGLLGIALDPDFNLNNRIYLFYSPKDKSVSRVSSFFVAYDSLFMTSERVIVEIPTQRYECCHTAGSMAFGPDGNLYIATGDNTNPHKSKGYAPIDDRPDRQYFDAQRTAANTNDLRGKILRIKPKKEGGYTIPEGNLFPKDGSKGKPEIYVMGCRNPYRISLDAKTGWLYWGNIGPDAREDSPDKRGPKGLDELEVAKKAGFHGWPFFIGNNIPYKRVDFDLDTAYEFFDPKAPINLSRNNTGITQLPPAQPALLWYPYGKSKEFPHLGNGGRCAMAGPTIHYNYNKVASKVQFPKYYDKSVIFYEWMRDKMWAIRLDKNGNFIEMERLFPQIKFSHPIDVELGPDGALYVLEYGQGWFLQNDDAMLSRIEFSEENLAPHAQLTAKHTTRNAPLEISLSAETSFDYDEEKTLTFAWFSNKNETKPIQQGKEATFKYTYKENGIYYPHVVVIDSEGATDTAFVEIVVGNTPPQVKIQLAGNQSFFWENRNVNYEVIVQDQEEKSINLKQVTASLAYLPTINRPADIGKAGEKTFSHGEVLLYESDCKNCHMMSQKSVGPSYKEISQRYQNDKQAIDKLAAKIIAGGGGVWGDKVMSAHPDMPQENAKEIVKYILSLSQEIKPIELPSKGTINLDKHTESKGLYVLSAAYTDNGGKAGKSLKTEQKWILRSTTLLLDHFDGAFKADKKKYNYDIDTRRFNSDSSFAYLKDIDMHGVTKLLLTYSTIINNGTIEIRQGSPVGNLLGKVLLKPTGSEKNRNGQDNPIGKVEIAITPTESKLQDLYVVLRYDNKHNWQGFVYIEKLELFLDKTTEL